jgi:hypothetical protein
MPDVVRINATIALRGTRLPRGPTAQAWMASLPSSTTNVCCSSGPVGS